MSITEELKSVLTSNRPDEKIQQFQKEYQDLLSKGVVHKKPYGLQTSELFGDRPSRTCKSFHPHSE